MDDVTMTLFYTRTGHGVVECCAVCGDTLFVKELTPDKAVEFAADLLEHAIEARRRLEIMRMDER